MGTQLPSQKGGSAPLIFCPFLLWPNGWMHQDGTWYGGRPQPRRRCVRWGPNPLPKKGWSHPNFGPRLLWPNGCIDQAVTWYGGRPRPTRRCVRWGTSSPPLKGHSPPVFGQISLWLNGLRCHLVWRYSPRLRRLCVRCRPSYPQKGTPTPPNFWPMFIVAKRLDWRRCLLVRK